MDLVVAPGHGALSVNPKPFANRFKAEVGRVARVLTPANVKIEH